MEIIKAPIDIGKLKEMSEKMFGSLVKAAIDVEKEVMAVDMPLHSDGEQILIENSSEPKNLWGINIYPEKQGNDFIEFDSMINLKPGLGNRTRGIENAEIRNKIILIVNKLIKK